MKNELENVKAKESKTSLKITETDQQRLFDIAFDVAFFQFCNHFLFYIYNFHLNLT